MPASSRPFPLAMKRHRPSSSAAVSRAVALEAPQLARHGLWLVAGMLVAFLGAALATIALLEHRRVAVAPAPVGTVVATTTTTVSTGRGTWRTTHQRVVAAQRANLRVRPDVLV